MSPTSPPAAPELPPDLAGFLQRLVRNTAILAGGVAFMLYLREGWEMAYSVLVSAALFVWSLRWQAMALSGLLASAADSAQKREAGERNTPQNPGKLRSDFLMRLPLMLLALAAVLWYTPARPGGVIAGIACVLVSAILAALSQNSGTRPSDRR